MTAADAAPTPHTSHTPAEQPGSAASGARARREALVARLRQHGEAEVAALPALFGVSVETIRRDLRQLESTGRIIRSYGRVTAAESAAYETSQSFRSTYQAEEKARIARAAAAFLEDAETVFLDEGNQPLLVGRALPADRDLTVVTASLPVAVELAKRPRYTVICVGGRVRPTTLGAVDHWATAMLGRMEPDLAFIGANGVTDDGWMTTPDPAVAAVKETALAVARRAVFVGSHMKFGHSTFVRFAHVRAVERIITGRELRSATARRLSAMGPQVERV
ncbi:MULTISPECIES: DeoR/GlpR family DNA-binding transcription regulator [unclassified Actinomyces]|uniref:DeoR/GlpR family DNA-binding transcription regulator n=1 Tax=unclassified Actinomyces TaxID=2609248 RepID=UPI0020178AC7|nr:MULTISPECIES: DeoR/GlpR family DNA-binding transcription regulator [unclassified Actinomyces]MCL3778402.1 DeoR/GlpR transcriptional regulator [Actinomyces sp. AC-20-1]MCL3790073.1 DeoR/GlpR transcriptional regulator [Actinomyces sp. 187325]MCL3792326.1 DeoR/GlpR transcriptional regulator [Actinomyces sp. 186855]MCL3794904.1 DeoR/GlpR transcriptional regulator [Actinomyces sp. 217892]